MRGLSLVAASGGHSSSRCASLSPSRPLLLGSTGSRRAGSAVVAHGPSCSAACGIFPDQGSNPCPLHWQADSQPLNHQGSPNKYFYLQVTVTQLEWSPAENGNITAHITKLCEGHAKLTLRYLELELKCFQNFLAFSLLPLFLLLGCILPGT